jgi:hypothetical protein
MLEERELTTFARGAAGALKVIGPITRAQVLEMLCVLGLTPDDAGKVLLHGFARGIFVDSDGKVAAGPET